MKTLYIGDIHGDHKVVQKIRYTYGKDYRKVFLGDLVDSFEHTYQDQEACVLTVLEMIEKDNDTDCLIGNHELSYLLPHLYRCSGYNRIMETLLMPLVTEIWKHFKFFIYDEQAKLLATHAGLTQPLWNELGITLENIQEKLTELAAPPYHRPFFNIGRARGGMDLHGGPLWCDWYEEFQPVKGLTQVFGHTPRLLGEDGIRQKGDNYNIDCVQCGQILLLEDGKFRKIKIGEK